MSKHFCNTSLQRISLFSLTAAFFVALLASPRFASASVTPVPAEIQSAHFRMTINGRPAEVAHAAAKYYFVNFDLDAGKAEIAITAPTDDYWAKGVEVQPWRFDIRPAVRGRTITFSLDHPAKLSITRPKDHLANAEMLFLFANPPEKDAPLASAQEVRYYGPGAHHENIDAHSGDTIYLAPGAVVFGSLNLWDVHDVKVYGRGTIVYDGPQNPNADEGWKNLPNWHVIVMHNARNISISGITCIVRSRTWMIQMRDSRFVTFDNVKVIGGSPGNANQDGMDWLGGGDTVIRDCFLRAADDIFAMYGNWDGYTEEALTTPGHDVSNILVEDSVLSTSISNVVRVGWPKKIFNSHNFTMRNSDVIHMGIGGCGVPFALLEMWVDPAGSGQHSSYFFQNIRLEDWYSLLQIRQPDPSIRDVHFENIWAIESPSMVPSMLKGDVEGVSIANFKVGAKPVTSAAQVPLDLQSGAAPAAIPGSWSGMHAKFSVSPSVIKVRETVTFDASSSSTFKGKIASYEWLFGDGTSGTGRITHHKFPDADGTLRDGSGRFRVLLKITDDRGNADWSYQPAVVTTTLQPPELVTAAAPGLSYSYYETSSDGQSRFTNGRLPDPNVVPAATGVAAGLDSSMRKRDENYALTYDGYISIPRTGGYTFTLLSRDRGLIQIGSTVVATSPEPVPQVCGSAGNAMQAASGTIGLLRGMHRIHVVWTHSTGDNDSMVRWEGPGVAVEAIPSGVLNHLLKATTP